MKKGVLIFVLLYALLHSSAQTTPNIQVAVDTIVKLNSSVITGNITTITPLYISFVLQGTPEEYTIERKEVHKVIYKTGRIEIFNNAAFEILDDSMWEAVWLTDKKKDVGDLYVLGEIESTSPSSARSAAAAKKGAIIKLQKKAANMNGTVILVTKKQNTGGFGEYPGYYIKGIAYGPEPPETISDSGTTGVSLNDAGM
ncbi:MAG: hypothetical protein JXB19_06790 [Bacteroidales bacterium]|nr:hypothetical protein [Bacteroidales bacterium]